MRGGGEEEGWKGVGEKDDVGLREDSGWSTDLENDDVDRVGEGEERRWEERETLARG
jgi:hypothetical protein